MSLIGNNIIYNGDFTSPSLEVNTFKRMNPDSTLTSGGIITGWTYANILQIALCNGVLLENGYKIAPASSTQYVFITGVQNISQTINISQIGTYNFSINYCKNSTLDSSSNKFVISIDGIILTSTPSIYGDNWTTLYGQVQILTTGNKVFKVEGTTTGAQGAFTNCILYYNSSLIIPPLPDPAANKFNRTTIYGSFSVQDKYTKYDKNSNYSGTIADSGNSTFYGNLVVKGNSTFEKDVILPNYYDKTYIDISLNNIKNSSTLTNYYTKTYVDASLNNLKNSSTLTNYYNKTYIDASFNGIVSGTTLLTNYYTKSQSDAKYHKTADSLISLNDLEIKNNSYMTADGTQSIYFLDNGYPMVTSPGINPNQIGRLFGTPDQMYLDFNDYLDFRFFTNKNNSTDSRYIFTLGGSGVYVNPTTSSTSSSNGSLVVSGGAGIAENINIGGNAKINSTTSSTSIGTGALIVSGGIGIAENANIGGTLTVSGSLSSSTQITAPTFRTTGVMYSAYYLLNSSTAYTWSPTSHPVVLAVSSTGSTITLPSNLPTTGNNSQELTIYKIVAGNLVINIGITNMIYYIPTNTRGNSFTITVTSAKITCRWFPGYPVGPNGGYVISVTN